MIHKDSSTLDSLIEGDKIRFEIIEKTSLHITTYTVCKTIDKKYYLEDGKGDNIHAMKKLNLINLRLFIVVGPKENVVSYINEIFKICDLCKEKYSNEKITNLYIN